MSAIDWTTVEDAIRDWVVTGTGLSRVIWSHERGPRPESPYISLLVTSIARVGRDWLTVTENTDDFDSFVFTPDHTVDTLTKTAHGLATGDGPVQLTTTGTLPTGLTLLTDYWVIRVDADTLQLATSLALANDGTEVTFSTNGTGVHTLAPTDDFRLHGKEITFKARGPRYCTLSVQCFADRMIGGGGATGILTDLIASLPLNRYTLTRAGVGVAGFGAIGTIGEARLGTVLEPRAFVEMQFHLASEVTGYETFIERVELENENTGVIRWVPDPP